MKNILFLFSSLFFSVIIYGQCNEPSNISLTEEPWDYEIYISWDANGESNWDVEYGETGFTPSGVPTVENISSTYFDLYQITEHTYIDFYVRADCGSTTSDWVGPFTFYNHCLVAYEYFQLEESFEDSFIPDCWTQSNEGTPNTGVGTFGTSAWEQANFANDSSNSLAAKINISGTEVNEWLILPPLMGLQLCKNESDLELNFDIALTQANSNASASLGSDDVVKLLISPDLGETWFTIHSWDKDANISNTGNHVSFIYYNGSDGFDLFEKYFLVAFWANSGSTNDSENVDFFIDNMYAEPPATGAVTDLESKGFSYYPNPSNNSIWLNAKEKVDTIILYNQLGQEVKKISVNSLHKQIDISTLPKGLYFMKVEINDVSGIVSVLKN